MGDIKAESITVLSNLAILLDSLLDQADREIAEAERLFGLVDACDSEKAVLAEQITDLKLQRYSSSLKIQLLKQNLEKLKNGR